MAAAVTWMPGVVFEDVGVEGQTLCVGGGGRSIVGHGEDVVDVADAAAGEPTVLVAVDGELTQAAQVAAGGGLHRQQSSVQGVADQPAQHQPGRLADLATSAAAAIGDLAGDLGGDRAVAA